MGHQFSAPVFIFFSFQQGQAMFLHVAVAINTRHP